VTTADLRPVAPLASDHEVEEFDCGVPVLDAWLRRSAATAAATGTAATYVLCRGPRVVGYYALAMSSVTHTVSPSRLRRGMPDPVPVVLLARLGLHRSEQAAKLGGQLLVDALRRCVRGGREFGARAIIVDAIDDRAAAFYQHFDFHPLEEQRLWRRLSDVAKALGEPASR
jgi:predicted N-acetyltransferase YhbS